jgi:hypothetical protein
MTVLADYLKSNIPEYFQTKKDDGTDNDLIQYLNGVGEFMEEIREAINQLEVSRDPYRATKLELDGATSDYGIRLPTNLPIEDQREFLRDINEIIKKGGTRDWLNLILRFIGGQVDVQEAWIYDPLSFSNGFYRDIETGNLERINIDSTSYTKLLYGDYTVDASTGNVYFSGYKYQDFNKLKPYSNIPILGEKYNQNFQSYNCVAKTPYVLVRLKSGIEGYNLDISDYVDENGTTYSFSVSEKYQIANDLVSYFLTNVQRPSTVKIIISVNEASIGQDDSFTVVDDIVFLENIRSYIDTQLEQLSITDSALAANTYTSQFSIGSAANIGNVETPIAPYATLLTTFFVGTSSITTTELENWTSFTLNIPYSLNSPYNIRMRTLMSVSFTNTSSANILVYGLNLSVSGTTDKTLLTTVIPGSNYTYNNIGSYFLIRIESASNVAENLPIVISAQPLNRGL